MEEADENFPEFDTTSSSIRSKLRAILEDLNQSQDSPVWESSDPDVTKFLIGLINDQRDKFSNPFQLADNIKRELVRKAEDTGARALSWDLSQFDKVGGRGTIRSVWNNLKSDNLVGGKKRCLSKDSSDSDDPKKPRLSLNLSGTCEMINNIELEEEVNEKLILSFSLSGDREEVGELNEYEDAQEVPSSVEEHGNSDWYVLSDSDSIPPLASTEPPSSDEEYNVGNSDSGMVEEERGNVTNLCRSRKRHIIREGVITETGPFLPVSLGFSMMRSEELKESALD